MLRFTLRIPLELLPAPQPGRGMRCCLLYFERVSLGHYGDDDDDDDDGGDAGEDGNGRDDVVEPDNTEQDASDDYMIIPGQ